MTPDALLRQQLVNMLLVAQAHISFEEAVARFPAAHYNTRPPNVEYTFWHLLEHVRFCQRDILDYIRNPDYKEPRFPDDLWQPRDTLTDAAGWQATIDGFLADRAALVALVHDLVTDLYAQIPHAHRGHSVLREVLIVADHNAYHIGELAVLRQVMGLW